MHWHSILVQKDIVFKRDAQSQRIDDLKIQFDDMHRSKDYLERSQLNLIDEINTLKNKVDVQVMNLNSFSGYLKDKAKKLEDDGHHHVN